MDDAEGIVLFRDGVEPFLVEAVIDEDELRLGDAPFDEAVPDETAAHEDVFGLLILRELLLIHARVRLAEFQTQASILLFQNLGLLGHVAVGLLHHRHHSHLSRPAERVQGPGRPSVEHVGSRTEIAGSKAVVCLEHAELRVPPGPQRSGQSGPGVCQIEGEQAVGHQREGYVVGGQFRLGPWDDQLRQCVPFMQLAGQVVHVPFARRRDDDFHALASLSLPGPTLLQVVTAQSTLIGNSIITRSAAEAPGSRISSSRARCRRKSATSTI